MARVEELPDDFDESLNLNDAPMPKNNQSLADMVEKRLDPGQGISKQSFEQITQEMSKTPIFMNDLDVAQSIQDSMQNV